MAKNERITENITKDILRDLGYYTDEITIEDQSSEIAWIKKALKGASKSGKGGNGYPEFIITSINEPDFVLIFECKADVRDHENKGKIDPVKYAIDGVLHYSKFLSREKDVISVAVSGQNKEELKVSSFIQTKGSEEVKELKNGGGNPINEILSFSEYIRNANYDPAIQKLRQIKITDFAKEMHEFMRDYAKLTEQEKPLLVSGTLIALNNKAFLNSYNLIDVDKLPEKWYRTIEEELKEAKIPGEKKMSMIQPFASISVQPILDKPQKEYPEGVLKKIITDIKDNVYPYISVFNDFDVVGQFYGEFLKYTGGDKKGLGIVLTPNHITELFSLLANVNKGSKVLDICTGTGGFLISAMYKMCKDANNEDEIENIKKNGLIGIEHQPNMFALAASNMILRGDGKANLHQSSCFDTAVSRVVKELKCDVGMINPPYSQKGAGLSELDFIKHMLNLLDKGATGIAIVPMSCAIKPNSLREELMRHHTLEAVMSMPDELFYPVGTVTCIMVFKAHIPHKTTNKKTWFGYWKDDGFEKTKKNGRIDLNDTWKNIRNKWVESFRNQDEIPGECVKKYVDFNDEWCAEAYLETDYSKITKEDFEQVVQNYSVFKVLN